MKIGSFEFNVREFAGSMGDFGTLFPLAIGYLVICKIHPAGLFVMIGLANMVNFINQDLIFSLFLKPLNPFLATTSAESPVS